MVKASGTSLSIVSELRYKPWGENRYMSYSETATPTDRRFTGQCLEQELGIYHYGARWYDPMLGRFLSPDTIVPTLYNTLDWDRYAYVRNIKRQ
jgi:RHS repeat-associated protein